MKNISEIMDKIKKISNLESDGEVASSLEMTKTALSNHKNRGTIPYEALSIYCEKNNISLDELLFDRHMILKNETAEKHPEDNGYVYIPQVTGEISAGIGLIPDNTIELKIAFRKEWIQRKGDPKNMSLIRIRGDSMYPTLLSGDIALIDHNQNYLDPEGGIYALAIDHQIMIKRLQLLYPVKKVKIISDNNKYESFLIEPDEVKINGKVIWFGREIEK